MTFQLQPQSAPPDRKKALDQALDRLHRAVESVLTMMNQPDSPEKPENSEKSLSMAIRDIDTQLVDLGALAHSVNADNEELKMVAGKLRAQRDDAIKARDQVLAYLRQLKKPLT